MKNLTSGQILNAFVLAYNLRIWSGGHVCLRSFCAAHCALILVCARRIAISGADSKRPDIILD